MNKKDFLTLAAFSLFLGLLLFGHSRHDTPLQPTMVDTPKPVLKDVEGKVALFIGDSHTANHSFGWQKQVCKKTGMILKNTAVSGKATLWMVETALYNIQGNVGMVFVYGGANDMYGNIPVQDALENLAAIARMCAGRRIPCYILTGFDPYECISINKPQYKLKYQNMQLALLEKGIPGATIINTRVVSRQDCADGLCHMTLTGHTKVADAVVKACKFKTIN